MLSEFLEECTVEALRLDCGCRPDSAKRRLLDLSVPQVDTEDRYVEVRSCRLLGLCGVSSCLRLDEQPVSNARLDGGLARFWYLATDALSGELN